MSLWRRAVSTNSPSHSSVYFGQRILCRASTGRGFTSTQITQEPAATTTNTFDVDDHTFSVACPWQVGYCKLRWRGCGYFPRPFFSLLGKMDGTLSPSLQAGYQVIECYLLPSRPELWVTVFWDGEVSHTNEEDEQ